MNITLIGSGNVATVLGRRFVRAGHRIVQVLSPRHAKALAHELGAEPIDNAEQLQPAELYLIAASDTAITGLAQTLRLQNALVAHTAGSLPKNILTDVSSRYGVLYPLQSIRKEVEPSEIPLLIDGNTQDVIEKLETLAQTITTTVSRTTDQDRLFFHIGGVVVNNFPNYLYALTELYLQDKGLDWRMLLPLMTEMVARLYTESPTQMQTGPAIRGDEATLDKHKKLLEGYPELQGFYERFSVEIRHSLAISRR